jgi:hypothetical protein
MKKIAILILCILISGCAFASYEIAKPATMAPACSKEHEGMIYGGRLCLKYSDGAYRWTDKQPGPYGSWSIYKGE